MKSSWRVLVAVSTLSLLVGGAFVSSVTAMRFSSTDYVIDTAVLNNVGGYSSSTNYQLTSSGGEAAIGNGASGSYKMGAGYVAQIITPAITVETQPSNLVAYYPLDENSGTFIHDNSSNANIGSFVNTPTWTAGKIGQSLTFDGSTQAIDIGNPTQTQITNGTIELWMKSTTSITSAQAMVRKSANFWVGLNSGKLAIYDWTTSVTCTGVKSLVDGLWHHIAVTLQNGVTNGSILYVDGVQDKTCTWTPQSQAGTVTLGYALGSQYYQGTLDQVKIFNRILSPQEISAEYAAQNAGVETGLTLQTVLAGVSNNTTFDVITLTSGSSYNLAINQDHNLQNGANTIPGVSGSIASPSVWSEGTTKGLGFTLKSTNATAIPGSWNSGNSYAALPSTSTSFYTRTGTQSSNKDILGMQLRLDVATNQPSGAYSNTMTVTGTANP